MDIEFVDLTYTVQQWRQRGVKKTLLKGVTGRFKSGELSAIMGPSGAGKTSLLNVLSGFRTVGVSGSLMTGGRPRNERLFQKLSRYITQEDLLQPLLTVGETMMMAAALKLPANTTDNVKQNIVNEILVTLGLKETHNTFNTSLSGGEKKRLSVALELINNPPVLFLDEPTSGLDDVTAKHCISLLKLLAQQGRTIVCTIHQPSASLFQLFDSVYVVAKGMCVYQGSTQTLVSFLCSVRIACPTNHNPADFVIEITDSDDKSMVTTLSSAVRNGYVSWSASGVETIAGDGIEDCTNLPRGDKSAIGVEDTSSESGASEPELSFTQGYRRLSQCRGPIQSYSISGWLQFTILLKRMLLQISRNRVALRLQLFHHLFCGLAVGLVFFNQANDGSKMFNHMKFCIGVIFFHAYTWAMVPILLFPSEVKLLKKEHFNRWYSLLPYYTALMISKLPLQVFLSIIFLSLVYFMSGLPGDLHRFAIFSLIGIIVSLIAEGLGLAIGSIFNVTNGSAAGPSIIALFLGLAIYGFDFARQISWLMNFIMKLSFVRGGVVALVLAVFSMGREHLNCNDVYCHYSDPKVILRMLDIENESVWTEISLLCGCFVTFRIVFYIALRWQLRN